jgi:nucleoside-diphosphate-sugar epimerase
MQNLSTTHLPEIRDEGRLFVPAGKGRTNFIDTRDIAEAAALALLGEGHAGKAYALGGPKSYSYGELADELSAALGRTIRYEDPGALAFLAYHLRRGRALGMSLVMLALYTVVKAGKGDMSADDTARLLGREPRSLGSFLSDYKALFLPERAEGL